AELFFPVSGALSKTPPETWRQYEPIFRGHSTAVMTPAFLAALAQVEGAGNPGSPHVLALAAELESVRAVPPGIERSRHVPDYRWNVPRSAALLHPRSCSG